MHLSKRNKNKQTRRQRPVSGNTSSAKMFSYYRSSSATRSADTRSRGQDDRTIFSSKAWHDASKRFGGILLGLFALVCLVLILQLDSSNPKIKILNPNNNYSLHSEKEYRATITSSLRSSFANNNKITINSHQVAGNLEKTYPVIGDSSLVLPLIGHRPIVYISLNRPVLIMRSTSQNIVIDSAGQALVVASSTNKLKKFDLPVLTDSNNLSFERGDVVLSGTSVEFIQTILRQLEAKQIKSAKMILPPASEELHFYPKKADYYIKFNLHENNARQQVGSYLAVRSYLREKGVTPKQYIDVRLGGRAYYR